MRWKKEFYAKNFFAVFICERFKVKDFAVKNSRFLAMKFLFSPYLVCSVELFFFQILSGEKKNQRWKPQIFKILPLKTANQTKLQRN